MRNLRVAVGGAAAQQTVLAPVGRGHGAAPSLAGRAVRAGLGPFLMTVITFLKIIHNPEQRAVGTPNKMARTASVRPALLAGTRGWAGDYGSRHASGRRGVSRRAPRPEVPARAARRGGPAWRP